MAIGAAAARRLVPVSLGGLALNLVATVVLAERYGLAGAAAATFLASIVVTPVVARICGEVFDHSTSVLVRACAPGLVVGLLVAGTAAIVTALHPRNHRPVLAAAVAAVAAGLGLFGSTAPALRALRTGSGSDDRGSVVTPAASLVACVIPAWAGSKRIADKNLAEVGGRSLLAAGAASTALAAFDDVVVSTDSERYAAVARDAGARVPVSVRRSSPTTRPRWTR